MFAIVRKEINTFFSTVTGYIVITVFLIITGLFLWVFPGEFNIPESGYSGLEPLFYLAPWVFLFLIPAITMNAFTDEKKSGTLDLLLTKPIRPAEIIWGKFIASHLLVLLALVPTLIYYYTVVELGSPRGNIDHAATIGSYIGLVFLSAVYVAVGNFTSLISGNQVVAFILAVILTLVLFTGFDMIALLPGMQEAGAYLMKLGMNEHYKSMSRGVIDSRDVVYFLALIAIFHALAKWLLTNKKQ